MKIKDIKRYKETLYLNLINSFQNPQFRTFRITIREKHKLINNIVNENVCVLISQL